MLDRPCLDLTTTWGPSETGNGRIVTLTPGFVRQ